MTQLTPPTVEETQELDQIIEEKTRYTDELLKEMRGEAQRVAFKKFFYKAGIAIALCTAVALIDRNQNPQQEQE